MNLQLVLAGTENQAWIFGYAGKSPQFFRADSSGMLAKLEVPGDIFWDEDTRIKDGIVSGSGELVVLNSRNVWKFSEGTWKPLLDTQYLFGSVKYSLQRFIFPPGGSVLVLGKWQDSSFDSSRTALIPWSAGKFESPVLLDIDFSDFSNLRSTKEMWVKDREGFSFYKDGSKLISVKCEKMLSVISHLYPDPNDDDTAYAVELGRLWKIEDRECVNLSYKVEALKDVDGDKLFVEVFNRDRVWLLSRGGILISFDGKDWRRQRITPLAVTLFQICLLSFIV
ncbi:MAG: hypothetical protein NZ949_08420 [Candidatus Kapabacteria bacterium]|nr:hypothetical protein [Candidatus Kapabacteria bacterium]